MIPISVVSLFLVLSLNTATAIFVLWRMKFRRSPKDTETGKEMKQDLKLKMTQCDIAEHKTPVALAPNKAYITCDIPKFSNIPVFSNETYNTLKARKVPVLPNAEYAVYSVAQCSKSTEGQEMKSFCDTKKKEKCSVATTQANACTKVPVHPNEAYAIPHRKNKVEIVQVKAESACTKVPVHPNEAYAVPHKKNKVSCYAKIPVYPNGAYAVPHRKDAVGTEGSSLTKVAVYSNEAYAIPQRKAEVGSEVPEQAKVAFTPNEAYGVGDVAPYSKGKEVKKLKCVGGSKSKITIPFVPRKTKAGVKSGCAKVVVFPNEAYAVCGLSAATKGREMTQQKSVCHTKSKVTGSIVLKKSSSFPKVPECIGTAVFPNVTYEQVGQEQDEAVYESVI